MIFNDRKSLLYASPPQALIDAEDDWQIIARTPVNKKLIKRKVYKGTIRENGRDVHKIRDILCIIYHNKCAYCEAINCEPDVEHYRPQKGVTESKVHSGYYWLCYEWSNLIPSCADCNRPPGKGNKFPIMGVHETKPYFLPSGELDKDKCRADKSPLINEKPYLLHPEIDDCKQFFKFHADGRIEGIDSEGRGEATWKICNLNLETLLMARQSVLDDFVENIKILIVARRRNLLKTTNDFESALKLYFKKLDKLTQPNQAFSLIATYAREHFDEMIISLIKGDSYQNIISQAHKKYLNGTL